MGGSRHSVLLSHCLYVMLHHICHRGPSPPFYLSQYILSAVIIKVTGVPLYLSQSVSSSRSWLLSSLSSFLVVVVLIFVFVVFNVLIVSISSYSLLFLTTVTLFLSIEVNTQHLSFFIATPSPPPCSSGRHHLLHRWLWAGPGVDVMHRRPFVPLIARAI